MQRLCADYLISPEGRRLSVERGEIERTLKLDAGTLQHLVDRRLLRSDQRTDRSYFELSHDSLVEPILATSRRSRVMLGVLGLIGSGLLIVLALVSLLGGGLALMGRARSSSPHRAYSAPRSWDWLSGTRFSGFGRASRS